MNKKIIWVFGASASGKETFVKYLLKSKRKDILENLNITDSNIVLCKESVDYVSIKDGDGLGEKRKILLKKVESLSKKNYSGIFLKGQDLDLENDRPKKLRSIISNYEHVFVYLYTDLDLMYKRCLNKPWWDKKWGKKEYVKWLNYELKLLEKLKNFEIIALESDDNKTYKKIPFPPNFN